MPNPAPFSRRQSRPAKPAGLPRNPQKGAGFIVIGHRGDGAGSDENTLASCRRAIQHGADIVELDVKLFHGELVLAHNTPTEQSARLQDVVPKLTVPIALHLKRHRLNPWHDRKALAQLSQLRYRPGFSVSSFWPGTLTHAKRRYPKMRTGFITFWPRWDLRFSKRLGASEFCVSHRSLSKEVAADAKRKNVRLFAFTANEPSDRIRQLADGVITDDVSAWNRTRARH